MRQAPINRRRFIGQLSCAAVTASPLISTLLNLDMTNVIADTGLPATGTADDDYKALVCLMLAGGNDSFNMLVPAGVGEYDEYATTRSNLALPRAQLASLNGTHQGKRFGLHPGMADAAALYNQGDLAFVANVGTLIEPTTLTDYNNGRVRVPDGLFSHSDQIMHWQTSVPDSRSATGWGGRVADILSPLNRSSRISMNISLAGMNVFQNGNDSVSYAITAAGNGSVEPMAYPDDNPTLAAIARTCVRNRLDAQYTNLFQQTFATITAGAIDASRDFATAVEGQTLTTPFSNTALSQDFQMVARTIAARATLGARRQTFFILMGGYDHHNELLNSQAGMLPLVNNALKEFNTAMREIGMHDKVTTFTVSDFARTLTSNGRGTDHAWGGNHLVMGGAVNGGQIYGTYPDLGLGSILDTGRGRLIPTLSTDEYFAELALWFGVQPNQLDLIFPNLSRFYQVNGTPPLGLFSQPS
jgi:uncharacterized protein (DUF1501 family)